VVRGLPRPESGKRWKHRANFPYDLTFDRKLGWLTDWDELALRSRRVAIADGGSGRKIPARGEVALGATLLEQNDQCTAQRRYTSLETIGTVGDTATVSLPAVARSQCCSGASLLLHVMGHDRWQITPSFRTMSPLVATWDW